MSAVRPGRERWQDAAAAPSSEAGWADGPCSPDPCSPDPCSADLDRQAPEIPGKCAGGVDLTGRSEAETRTILVAQTARFTASFLRWMETRACDGMSYVRLRLLEALHCGGPAIMRDLGTQLGTTPRNMTAIVDALEDAHLVVRRPHPTDRRATLIELSPEGAREVEQGLGPRLDAMSEIFAGLSAGEREQFSAAMSKLMLAISDREHGC